MVLVNHASAMGADSSAHESDVNNVGIPQEDHVAEIYLEVSVINPITRKERNGELYTTYAIYIETNDSAFTMSRSMVRRRYSEFVILRSILQEQHPSLTVPRLPARTLLGKRFDQRFIQDRCCGLHSFLKAIVEQPVYLSNKSLHLFLQSSLTMEQVQNVVNGGESFELPHNNSASLLLYPVDSKAPNETGRVGILKREICSSLATCAEHECRVQTKHEHMRVGSGIKVCPYTLGGGKGGPTGVRYMSGSAPFNIPGGSPRPTASKLRNCASDTCLEGAAAATNSLNGSKKRVSFVIDKEKKQSLLRRRRAAHKENDDVVPAEDAQLYAQSILNVRNAGARVPAPTAEPKVGSEPSGDLSNGDSAPDKCVDSMETKGAGSENDDANLKEDYASGDTPLGKREDSMKAPGVGDEVDENKDPNLREEVKESTPDDDGDGIILSDANSCIQSILANVVDSVPGVSGVPAVIDVANSVVSAQDVVG